MYVSTIMERIGREPSTVANFNNYLEEGEKMSFKVEQRKLLLKLCNKGGITAKQSHYALQDPKAIQLLGTLKTEETEGRG